MYIHPDAGLRLAQVTLEEARSRAQRASARSVVSLERRESGVNEHTRRWAATMLAATSRPGARRRKLRASTARTPKG